MLSGYKGTLSVGSIFKITSLGKADGGTMSEVTIHGRVVRVKADGNILAFDYLEVDGRGYALLQAFMAERMALLNEESPIY